MEKKPQRGFMVPDRPIAFNRDFVRLGIKVNGALFLSQSVYWTKRAKNNGWFYKTVKDWEKETGLTEAEQKTIKRKLLKLKLVEIKKKGIPAKNYFKVNLENLYDQLVQLNQPHQSGEINRTGDVNLTSLSTEITTETTHSAKQSFAKKKSSEKFSPSPSLIRKKVLIEKAAVAVAQNSIVRVPNVENGIDSLETTENLAYPQNFNKSEAINKMLAPYKKDGKEIKPQRHISIIGLYILVKNMQIESKEQLESIIKRNIRAASPLKPYSFKKIIKTLRFLKEKANFKWTLETVSKFIDEDLEKINMNSIGKAVPGKILGEDVTIKN